MLKWVNLLHIYQPPYQKKNIIAQVADEGYEHLIKTLEAHPQAKLSLNLSGSLIAHLQSVGREQLLQRLAKLVKNGQVELVGSAMYHPILPLIPVSEAEHQIKLNEEALRSVFGSRIKLNGFYLPELAYSLKIAKLIKKLGYKWLMLDEISLGGKLDQVDFNRRYRLKGVGLDLVFRHRQASETFVPHTLLKLIGKSNPPKFVVTGTDGEIYGHQHKDPKGEFTKVLSHPNIHSITVSDYLRGLSGQATAVLPTAASWQSTPAELEAKIPYALWQHPNNAIHRLLWELRGIAIKAIKQSRDTKEAASEAAGWARFHLDRGLASCAWWWAAGKQIGPFNFMTWDPESIERGMKELMSSIRSLPKVTAATKLRAEKIYYTLVKEIWKKHWRTYKPRPKAIAPGIERQRAFALLNQNFLAKYFKKNIPLPAIQKNDIDYIKIKTFKQKIGKQSFYYIVARYTIHFKRRQLKPVNIFCNANSAEDRAGTYLAMNHLWQNGFDQGDVRCSQPLFYDKTFRAMFYTEAEGENLYQHIVKAAADPNNARRQARLETIVTLSAKWQAKIHELPTAGVKNFNQIQSRVATIIPGPKHFLASIKKKHKDYPRFWKRTEQLFKQIDRLEKKNGFTDINVVHGDFHPENVIYNIEKPNQLFIIDFTDTCLAHFTRDLGSFIQQLHYMAKPLLPAKQITKLQNLFLSTYLETRGLKKTKEFKNRLALYLAWTSLRSAIFFLTITTFDRPRAEELFKETSAHLKKIKS